MKRSLRGLLLIGLVLGGIVVVGYAEALEFKSENVNVQFTFNYDNSGGSSATEPSLGITTPGDIALSANPGTAVVSTTGAITVTSNSPSGYILSAKVGCNPESTGCYNSTALKKNSSDSGPLNMISSAGTLSAGTWGISISSGTIGTTSNTFRPLSTSATVLNKTTNYSGTAASGFVGGNSIPYTVGMYPSDTQAKGTYTNKVTFMVTVNGVS